jgi:hypothetical protein
MDIGHSGMTLTGETPHCAILFTTYPAWTGVVLNLGLSDEKPATIFLSCGMNEQVAVTGYVDFAKSCCQILGFGSDCIAAK